MSNPYGQRGLEQWSGMGGGGAALFEGFGMAAQQDKYGVWTVQIPYVVKGRDSAWDAGQTTYGRNLDLVARSISPHEDGEHYIVTCTYQGKETQGGEGGGASYEDRSTVYDMQATWEEEPIETHPKISDLLKKYAGRIVNGEVVWDKEIPAAADSGLGEGESAPTKNPMYGVVRWKRLGVTWSATRVLGVIPAGILSGVGKTQKSVPGNPPNVPAESTWLKLPPKASKRGSVWQITEEWMLVDDKLPDELYGSAADQSSGGG